MNKFLSSIRRVRNFLQRYFFNNLSPIIVIGAIIWHLCFTDINYLDICHNDEKIRSLQKEIANEKKKIEQLQEEIRHTKSDATTIERIAREKHGMQQAHEDVYITIPPPDTANNLNTRD